MNILLVDDEMLAIEAICAKAPFEKYGITNVLTANSMQQAQSILQDNRVDIVFCDIEMPSGSGLELPGLCLWNRRYWCVMRQHLLLMYPYRFRLLTC